MSKRVFVSLGEICDLKNGYAFKSNDYVESSNTLNIRMSNIRPGGVFDTEHNKKFLPDSYSDKYSSFLLNDGDLLIAMTDMANDPKILGVPTIVKNQEGRQFLLNQRVGKLHNFSNNVYVPYLQYILNYPSIKLFYKSIGAGGVQVNISKADILSVKIPLPPLETQRRIAAVLEKADHLRSLRRQALARLDDLVQSVFLEMFGDPVTNPMGWEVTIVEAVSEEIVDCPHSTPKYTTEKTIYPCIRTTELKNGYIKWSSMKYLSEEQHNLRIKRLEPLPGDIVYGREGTFGEAAIIPENSYISLGQRVMLFRPKYEKCTSYFLWAMLRSYGVYRQAVKMTSGSTVGHVNIRDIKKFSIYLPPLSLQKEFEKRIKKIEFLKLNTQKSLIESNNLFNALMQKAFKGELQFAEAEQSFKQLELSF